ncbi:hypothetical protein [Polyangium fumosum]|uniref:VCBS repeat-containing protein n=1 Tax=Polyangium fumosum TaxID=889272 RepID=A0A4U1J7C2_9BACT|nr:hypothetical protein [Polyangium fumosum]TKD03262.1 hypothetical protein E8A74_26350 [Polyangium fumosum]
MESSRFPCPFRWARSLGVAALLTSLPAIGATACTSADPASAPPTFPTGAERDTEVKHEACDMAAANAQRFDANGDGKPDMTRVPDAAGRELCRVLDLNFDGAIDVFVYYDPAGRERRRESDYDRDGRADEIVSSRDGAVFLKERETNFDDKLDTWDYYEGGRLVRRERDSDGDGLVDQWWAFNDPTDDRCALVATDRNVDGKPDPETVLDLCAEARAKQAATPPKPQAPAPRPSGAVPLPNAPAPMPPGGAPIAPQPGGASPR